MTKVVLITGSSKGLGFSLAKEFSKKKYSVIMNGRSKVKLEQAKKTIEKEYPYATISTCVCDISNKNCAKYMKNYIEKKYNHIDYWINNAATCENKRTTLNQFSYDEIESIINTNLCGTMYGCKAACELMVNQQSGGKIINIDGSGSNEEIIPGFLVYSTSKAKIAYLGKFLDSELKHTNVQIHTMSPGIVETDFINPIKNRNKIFNAIVQDPDDVAKIIITKIEDVNGTHKHLHVYSLSRLFMLLLNIFKKP